MMIWLWIVLALFVGVALFGAGFYVGARVATAEIEDWLVFGPTKEDDRD